MSLPPPLQVDHRCRISALEAETLWSLEGDDLHLRTPEGNPMQTIPLTAIRTVNLRFEPTRMQTNRYRCHLTLADGRKLVFQNEHYAGFASFEDRSLSYRTLVTALVRRIPTVNPSCTFTTGTSALSWWGQLTGLVLMFLLLAGLLIAMASVIGALIILKLLLIAALLPVLLKWALKNRPGTFDPLSPPAELLPGSNPA